MSILGFYLRFAERMDAGANARLQTLTRRLLQNLLPGVTDLIPSYTSLYIEFDAASVTEARVRSWAAQHQAFADTGNLGRSVTIPVRYDGEDLPEVSARLNLSRDEFVRRHSQATYRVYAVGFSPGFPFLGEVDPDLRLPRRPDPRARVPAHSVAMANAQTGIYPLASPGGWNLLGHTLVSLYDPHREEPFLLESGDEVRFQESGGEVPPELPALELLPEAPAFPLFQVATPGVLDLMVDTGRRMVGRFGLSRTGALAPALARLANRLVGNDADTPLLELNVQGPVLRALRRGSAVFAGYGMTPLLNDRPVAPFTTFTVQEGDTLRFAGAPFGIRGYLAVAGGFESRSFLGSASVDLRGLVGRPLRRGDVLGVAAPRPVRPGFSFTPHFPARDPEVLRLLPGPQASSAALRALASGTFTVRTADRTGVQFEGTSVPGGEILSEAVPIGAVQVTPGGTPILLLHDRGTLGGYDKPALLHPGDFTRAAQLRPGGRVRFRVLAAH